MSGVLDRDRKGALALPARIFGDEGGEEGIKSPQRLPLTDSTHCSVVGGLAGDRLRLPSCGDSWVREW